MLPSASKQRIRSAFIRKTGSLRRHYQSWSEEWPQRRDMVRQRWRALLGVEKIYLLTLLSLILLVIIQFIWIASLQYQLSTLSELAQEHEYRLDKHGETLDEHEYTLQDVNSTLWDIRKKISDLNFRVLQNTWRTNKPIQKEAP